MRMKDYLYLCKSNVAIKRGQSQLACFAEREQLRRHTGKLQLFALLAMLVGGVSPAWAG